MGSTKILNYTDLHDFQVPLDSFVAKVCTNIEGTNFGAESHPKVPKGMFQHTIAHSHTVSQFMLWQTNPWCQIQRLWFVTLSRDLEVKNQNRTSELRNLQFFCPNFDIPWFFVPWLPCSQRTWGTPRCRGVCCRLRPGWPKHRTPAVKPTRPMLMRCQGNGGKIAISLMFWTVFVAQTSHKKN